VSRPENIKTKKGITKEFYHHHNYFLRPIFQSNLLN